MQDNLLPGLLCLFALFSVFLAVNSVWTGVVTWRGGAVAAERATKPGLFWMLVALQLAVAAAMVWWALS